MVVRFAALLEHLFITYSAITDCPVFRGDADDGQHPAAGTFEK
jgi:hypothetical protein